MQVALDRSDRKILIVAAVLLLLLVGATALVAPPQAAPAPVASSFSPGPTGAKAAYVLLGDLGYQIERWEQPLSELPSLDEDAGGEVLILCDPYGGMEGDSDREHLAQFVRRGGRVLFAGSGANDFLPLAYSKLLEPLDAVTKTYSAVAVSPLTRGAPSITMAAPVRWNGGVENESPLYANNGDVVAATFTIGKGQVIWWASSMPLSNAGIQLQGNLDFLLNTIGSPTGTRVLYDEYYHGERRSLTSYLAGTPVVWALVQVGLAYIVLLLAYGRRTGPIRMPSIESRLSPLEYVETLGALYQTAGAASGAVTTVWQRFRYLAVTRLGLPASASIRQINDSVRERLGWREPGLFEALQRADQATHDPSLNNRVALQIVESLEHYAGLLELNRTGIEENRTWRNR
jgi:hypothetical protein